MCGGTAETDLDSFEEVSLEAKDIMSDAQKESQTEYKESETSEEESQTEYKESETSEEESQTEYKESETSEEETTTTVLEKKIFWGATDAKPEVYAADDVSQATIDLTVEWVNKAISYWGNYGPLEIWIVGTGKEETIALDEKWCEVRTEKDPTWNKQWDCANGDPYESGNGWSTFYRYIND